MAVSSGLEPEYYAPEAYVLPLDDKTMVGTMGLEPMDVGLKTRCLSRLAMPRGGELETRTLKGFTLACFQDRFLIQPDTLLVGGAGIEPCLYLAYEASQFTRTVPSIMAEDGVPDTHSLATAIRLASGAETLSVHLPCGQGDWT